VADGVILAHVLISDFDRDVVVIDDVELERLVPHWVLATICKQGSHAAIRITIFNLHA
jgi:hypothetical protein